MSSYVAYDRMITLIVLQYEIPTISEFSFIGQQFSDMINAVYFKGIVAIRVWLFGGET